MDRCIMEGLFNKDEIHTVWDKTAWSLTIVGWVLFSVLVAMVIQLYMYV